MKFNLIILNYYFAISFLLLAILIWIIPGKTLAQENITYLTLDDVIRLANQNSIDALVAEQVFRQSFLEYRNFNSEKLPSVNLNIDAIDYNHSSTNRNYDYGSSDYRYYTTNNNTSSGYLTLNQNIPLTGGTIVAGMDLVRNDNFNLGSWDYASNPSIRYSQPLFGYNSFKWDNKIEPRRYEIAKAKYNQDKEGIALTAINYFFNYAKAQVTAEVARLNYQNADTLYTISQGRYNLGKISENELLQMELSLLNAKTSLNSSGVELLEAKNNLLSFLRMNLEENIALIIPDSVSDLQIIPNEGITIAKNNNPQMLLLENQLLEARQQVAQSKAEKGINANLALALGYSRIDTLFPEIITNRNNISDYQNIRLSLQIPIVDWGVNKGKYKIALLNEEISELEVEQAIIDFEQYVSLNIINFNQQKSQLEIAKKSEIVAERLYEVSKQRFLIGKIDVLDLNVSQKDRDNEKANYINSLRQYWVAFYTIRQITLYDFQLNENINHHLFSK